MDSHTRLHAELIGFIRQHCPARDQRHHHHGVKGLVDTAAGLQPVGKEATLPQFGDGEGQVARLGGEQASG